MYGWGLLLVTQTGGMAAVAVIFASYFRELTGTNWNDGAIAAVTLLTLTGINCLGARGDLSRGLLIGVGSVVALYLAVNLACLRVLGPAGLDATTTPASDLMRMALGQRGAQWIAIAITISTLGFLSQSMLTAPRVYY